MKTLVKSQSTLAENFRLYASKLKKVTTGTSGNMSLRSGAGFFVTPSGVPYDEISDRNCPWLSLDSDGEYSGMVKPSSEWRFHRDILKSRSDVNAVVHAHTTYATALSICGKGVPACHYSISIFGGPVRVAPYAIYGSEQLSKNVVQALGQDRDACLLENHGAVTVGKTLEEAFNKLVELEELCHQYQAALNFGEPRILPEPEIDKVITKLKGYGQK